MRHASIGAAPHPGQLSPRYRPAFPGASSCRRAEPAAARAPTAGRSAWRWSSGSGDRARSGCQNPLGSKPNRLLRRQPPWASENHANLLALPRLSNSNFDQAGGDGLWYVVRMLRWEPIWKAFEKRCGLWRAGSEARCRSTNCLRSLEYLATTSPMCSRAATGQSAMRYMRGRRLSEAARVLANGGPDILTVALDFGYGSHEAFTRAFRDQFGLTPESVRAQRHLDNVNLVEAIKMDDGLITTLAPPRIEQGRLLLIAGLGGKYSLRHQPKHSGFVAALAAPSRQRPWASFCGRRRQRGADVWRLLQHGR